MSIFNQEYSIVQIAGQGEVTKKHLKTLISYNTGNRLLDFKEFALEYEVSVHYKAIISLKMPIFPKKGATLAW